MIAKLIKPIIGALLVLYFFFLVLSRTPATVGAWALHNAVPTLWLTGVEGTIWNGRSSGAQIDMGRTAIPLGQLEWRLNPWSILALNPCLSFRTSYPGQNSEGHLCQSIGGNTKIKNTTVDGSLSVVSELIPGASVSGRGSLQVVTGEFSGTHVAKLEAQLSWEQASVNVIDKWMTFGSYAAKLSENGQGGVKAKVFDIAGPYQIDMAADWMVKTGWKIEGTILPGEGALPEVKEGLMVVGEELEGGKYKLVWP